MEGVRRDNIKHVARGTGEGDIDDSARDCIDREPEREFVEGRQRADGLCALQHERDRFCGVPDAVRRVADHLADAQDARAQGCGLRGVHADVFGYELGLGVAHVLGGGEGAGQGLGDVVAGGVEDGAGGGAEVEGCGGGALGFEGQVDEVLEAGDAVFFEAGQLHVEVDGPGAVDDVGEF